MEEEHQDLEKPINGVLRNLKNTQSREKEESMNQQRDLSCYYSLRENPKKKTQKSFGLEESPESMKKILFRCVECGKGFRYEKCLSNHQAVMHLSTKQKVYEEEHMKSLCSSFSLIRRKKRSRVIRYKKTPLSCSFTTFLDSPSVSAENDEELEVADCLILLSKSSPKFVDGLKLVAEAIDANPETPKRSYDSGCLSSKKLRKAGEFEYGFLSNEQKLLKEGISSDETSKEAASFLGHKCELDQQKLRKGGEFGTEFSSNEQKLMEEGVSRYETWKRKLRKSGDFESDTELGVGAMECSDSDTEMVTESNKENIEHQCKLCNKIFSSYQALGGHQTFHRISKSQNKKHCRYECVEEEPEDESVTVTVKKHKCSICSRLFRSVHALGGHKKSHGKRQHSKTEDDHQDLGFLSVVPVTLGIEFY